MSFFGELSRVIKYAMVRLYFLLPALMLPLTASGQAVAQVSSVDAEATQQMVQRGVDYLRTRQLQDGSFSPESGTGVTSLVGTALLRSGVSPQDVLIQRSLAYVGKHVKKTGGIHVDGSLYKNYETCLAVMFLSEARDRSPQLAEKWAPALDRAGAFLRKIQWDAGEGLESSDPGFGGSGYGKHKRPDLSNTAFLVEALKTIGTEENDEAIQQALVFVSRCQNLVGDYNTTEFPAKVNDGGFYYTIAAGGSSQAGETANGGLRSYASMTYAGLKSMIYAGVGPEDSRVQAALSWIGKNYDLDSNPGMGDSGLFYYYHTFAKALDAAGVDQFEDEGGVKHDWRNELNAELAERQQTNGSWINQNQRWLEANPDLVTGYALLALSYTVAQ